MSHTTSPVTALTARKTWRTVEPLHGMVYFAPEAAESYRKLGLEGQSGYFASRSAPMGAVSAGTVVATFFNFRPSLVHESMDGVWAQVAPADVLDARLEAAGGALRRMLGAEADSDDVAAAADLATAAALRAGESTEGRPLFAGHAELPWPDAPLERLWHAQTLLREFRGDGHIALLVPPRARRYRGPGHARGPPPSCRWACCGPPADGPTRSGRRQQFGSATGAGSARRPTPDHLSLSDEGAAVRQDIEEATDRLSVVAYEAIGEEGCDALRGLVRPFSRAVVAAAGLGADRAGPAGPGRSNGQSASSAAIRSDSTRPWASPVRADGSRTAGSSTSVPNAAIDASSRRGTDHRPHAGTQAGQLGAHGLVRQRCEDHHPGRTRWPGRSWSATRSRRRRSGRRRWTPGATPGTAQLAATASTTSTRRCRRTPAADPSSPRRPPPPRGRPPSRGPRGGRR